jgi:translation elongation factor EF-G
MKRIVTGILAHVDAGKTTCIESMLYNAGKLRMMGRVDHKDAYLDYDSQERDRGITIYSKEANYTWKDAEIYLIDTPGHVDFPVKWNVPCRSWI